MDNEQESSKLISDSDSRDARSGVNINRVETERAMKKANIDRLLSVCEVSTVDAMSLERYWMVLRLRGLHCYVNAEEEGMQASNIMSFMASTVVLQFICAIPTFTTKHGNAFNFFKLIINIVIFEIS